MSVKKGQILELRIEKLLFGGRGLGWVDGLAVFVERAVPGDEVRARVFKKKKNHAEARVVELTVPSSFRVDPPCQYSGYCGGCTWQFLDYERQLLFKREHVVESLEHIGQIKDIRVHPVIPSEKIFAYRNKMEFSFSDRRWLLPEELSRKDIPKDFALGLHVPGAFDKVLDTQTCLLLPDTGNKILSDVRHYVRESPIPPYGLRSHKGFWRFLMLRHSSSHDKWMVNIITSEEQRPWVQPLADLLCQKHEDITSVVNNINTRKAGIAVGQWEIVLSGDPFILDKIAGFEFEISANSFFQTNTAGAARLYETVKAYTGLTGKETVVDLYSGTGTIPIFLCDSAREVIGIEISEGAVRDAEKNCRKNRIDNCRFISKDIKEGLKDIIDTPDVMVIDPPRVGMHKDVIKMVRSLSPGRIVYVSCNPATLARDLAALKEDYHLVEVQPVDMFPHTYHIESVARLEK
ncbi:MAG: 23S rRNA (uracil-5-)-methyltransferase RumA [Desulfobacterales bacterium S3730MH5]|nr:MAG: 23S rRNA (uracil-5-)-methyltransferase RumA [Desulfobacterales bacterium S3730MH5]